MKNLWLISSSAIITQTSMLLHPHITISTASEKIGKQQSRERNIFTLHAAKSAGFSKNSVCACTLYIFTYTPFFLRFFSGNYLSLIWNQKSSFVGNWHSFYNVQSHISGSGRDVCKYIIYVFFYGVSDRQKVPRM